MTADDNATLASLDWRDISCQWPKCYRTAVNETHTHVVDFCNNRSYADLFGNSIYLLCAEHTTELNHYNAGRIRHLRARQPRPACATCGAPLMVVSDIVRTIKPIESEDRPA